MKTQTHQPGWRIVLIGCAALVTPIGGWAVEPPKNCAVLADEALERIHPAFIDVFEAQLGRMTTITLLDRRNIDRVLAERRHALARSGDTPATWREIGQRLRANYLICLALLESEEGDALQVRVIDTTFGIRIADELSPFARVPGDPSTSTAQYVSSRLRRFPHGIEHIVVIPKFLCEDFTNDFGDLGRAYADTISALVRTIPGVAIVNLSDARAIAEEFVLSNGPATVERPQPFYVEGSYRNSDRTAARRVTLRIIVKHGQKALTVFLRRELSTEQVPEVLTSFVEDLKGILGEGDTVPLAEVRVPEAAVLASRVIALHALGEWEELAAAGESCLLLDPQKWRMHLRVATAYGHLAAAATKADRAPSQNQSKADRHPRTRRQLELSLAGLHHLRRYLGVATPSCADVLEIVRFCDQTALLPEHIEPDAHALLDLLGRVLKAKTDLAVRLAAPEVHDQNPFILDMFDVHSWSLLEQNNSISYEEFYQRAARVLVALDSFRNGIKIQSLLIDRWEPQSIRLVTQVQQKQDERVAAYERFLHRLANDSQGSVGVAVRIKRRIDDVQSIEEAREVFPLLTQWLREANFSPSTADDYARGIQRRLGLIVSEEPEIDLCADSLVLDDLRFQRLSLDVHDQFQFNFTTIWRSCCAEHDCVAQGGYVYAVYPGGRTRLLLDTREERIGLVLDLVVDNHLAWVLLRDDDVHLRVFELATGNCVAIFGAEDGLPPATRDGLLARVGTGRIVCVGSFGRSWIAQLTLRNDNAGQLTKRVDILHEARSEPLIGSIFNNPVASADFQFRPEELIVCEDEAGLGNYLIIRRRFYGYTPSSPTPLVLDLREGHIRPLEHRWSSQGHVEVVGNTAYHLGSYGSPCLGLSYPPHFMVNPLSTTDLKAYLGQGPWHHEVVGDEIHWVGDYWLTIPTSSLEVLRAVHLPRELRHGQLVHSRIFGLVYFGFYAKDRESQIPRKVFIASEPAE